MTDTNNPYGEFGQNGQFSRDGSHAQDPAHDRNSAHAQDPAFGQDPAYAQNPAYAGNPAYAQDPAYAQYAQYAGGWGGPQQGMARDAGFFSALFDFSFRKYATPSIVKVVYILITVVMSVGVLAWGFTALVSTFAVDTSLGAMLLIFGIPAVLVVFFLQLALFRMLLEAGLALVRAAQSLQNLEQRR